LTHFGSVANVRAASIDEIAEVKGMSTKLAQVVSKGLKK
jgi:excinuclease UvrABC nuclease subunit